MESLSFAGEASLELKQADEKLHNATTAYNDAQGSYWPRLSAAVDYVYKNEYLDDEPDPVRPYLSLSKTSFNDWQRVLKTRTAMSNLYAAKLSRIRIRRGTFLQAGEKYFDLLMEQTTVRRGLARLEQKRRDVEVVEKNFKLGIKPEIEVLRARTSIGLSMADLRKRKKNLEKVQLELAALLGLPPDIRPVSSPKEKMPDPPDRETALNRALGSDPELKLQIEALDRLRDLNRSIRWTRWPQLGAKAYLGYNPGDINNETELAVILTVSKDLFDGGSSRRRIDTSETGIRTQELAVKELEREIGVRIESMYSQLLFTSEGLSEARDQLETMNQLVEISKQGYEHGVTSFKEVLDAQAMAQEQESTIAGALAEQRKVVFRILLMTGFFEDKFAKDPYVGVDPLVLTTDPEEQ